MARVGVDVLHAAERRVGFVGVVEGTQGADDFLGETADFELFCEEVEVQQGADFFFRGWVPERFAVEPAYEELRLWNKLAEPQSCQRNEVRNQKLGAWEGGLLVKLTSNGASSASGNP